MSSYFCCSTYESDSYYNQRIVILVMFHFADRFGLLQLALLLCLLLVLAIILSTIIVSMITIIVAMAVIVVFVAAVIVLVYHGMVVATNCFLRLVATTAIILFTAVIIW